MSNIQVRAFVRVCDVRNWSALSRRRPFVWLEKLSPFSYFEWFSRQHPPSSGGQPHSTRPFYLFLFIPFFFLSFYFILQIKENKKKKKKIKRGTTSVKKTRKTRGEKRNQAKVVGFVLGHQPVRIDPAANNNNNSTLIGRPIPSSSAAMIPETTTLHGGGGGGGDADGRPVVIGEGPQHRHKNKQAREFEFVFGCEFPSHFHLPSLVLISIWLFYEKP